MSDTDRLLLSGNEAVALGAWQAGCRLASAYPGTPSSEIVPALLRWADKLGGHVYAEWSVNEKVALEVASGASMAGARAMVTMKHVGLNVAADPFFTLAYTGVEAGLVVLVADDPHMHSSQNEQDTRIYARHAGVPMLEPADSQEACDFGRLAFELSERFDTPVLIRMTTRVSHSQSTVRAMVGRQEREPGGAPLNPQKYTMIPAYARARHRLQLDRLAEVTAWAEETTINRIETGEGKVGFLTAGIAYEYLREILPQAPVLKLGLSYPLPVEKLRRFREGLDRLIVIEELEPFLYEQVRALGVEAERLPDAYRLGELTPARLAVGLREIGVESETAEEATCTEEPTEDLPPRPPVLCPGCPHRGVFYTLSKLKTLVTGDIGCYTLGTLEPLRALHTCLCMGAGLSQAHGVSKATEGGQKVVAVIGDSTFTHTGIPALLNAVYNRGSFVAVILNNRTTAMTGGQEHPGTGRNLMGQEAPSLDFARLAEALGVELVLKLPAEDLSSLEAGLKQALAQEGLSVVIVEGPCVLQYRVRGDVFGVDGEICAGCGMCLRLGCPALVAEEHDDRQWPRVDETLCTGCGLCAQVCPKKALAPVSSRR